MTGIRIVRNHPFWVPNRRRDVVEFERVEERLKGLGVSGSSGTGAWKRRGTTWACSIGRLPVLDRMAWRDAPRHD
ncbi:MAG: hypothetical protein EA380_00225 [Phycisphaeraceae bacterium]|nr:MAG: hypothetical protein EA380_00225 [Phycisphaeraceae bacterium]